MSKKVTVKRFFTTAGVIGVLLSFLSQGAAPHVISPPEFRVAGYINQARQASSLPKLTLLHPLALCARNHSWEMARRKYLHHSSSYSLRKCANAITPEWEVVGENVGIGSKLYDIHAAMMLSGKHKENILGIWKWLGTGVVYLGGNYYVTEIFLT